ncbi:PH domain-containing protein [Crossiella sp. SN42]|uniref:PH domain-containing protein n=1 Tax=Crossiella sp. SN42 TaxID=2944808 RepID=UPI00207D4E82|nr:PH domain-containing protein [Crossiella sp. SN42]MCO1580977.1 PH domain-containing protein [Crossiella sp. SN42]
MNVASTPNTRDRLQLRLREPANQVSPQAKTWWALQSVIVWVFALIALVVTVLIWGVTIWWSLAAAVVVVWAALDLIFVPRLRYRWNRWETTDQAVYTQTGWFSREWRIAPLSRVQTVDTERGPLQRALGLSTVTVTTASAAGALKIEGLDKDVAAALVDQLVAITEATPGDAT